MRILNKLFTKNKLKNNIECVFKHLIACSAIKSLFFSQEILGEERIPPGSQEENNALSVAFKSLTYQIISELGARTQPGKTQPSRDTE